MICPRCGGPNTSVVDTRTYEPTERQRRRRCDDCTRRFTTIEINASTLKRMRAQLNAVQELLDLFEPGAYQAIKEEAENAVSS